MALEAVVFSQESFGFTSWDSSSSSMEMMKSPFLVPFSWDDSLQNSVSNEFCDPTNSSPESCHNNQVEASHSAAVEVEPSTGGSLPDAAGGGARRKRRRTKRCKNKEEVESQRMTHINVERNRRRQMNEYLAIIRSLMPSSYVQRGDQASIIGGAINFVKELEQLSQTLEAQNKSKEQKRVPIENETGLPASSPFSDFFTYPQYSTRPPTTRQTDDRNQKLSEVYCGGGEAVADIEVTLVEAHANVKILIKRKPKQLLKMVVGIQSLRLSILHLNVTSSPDDMCLYSLSIKMDDGCQLGTADEIAANVNQMLSKIQQQS